MEKRIGGRTQLQLETMEARLVLTATTAVGLTAPPPAIVDVAVQEAPETPSDTGDTLARGVERADFNADGMIDAIDIDLLSVAINSGKFDALYDLDDDSQLSKGDMDSMIYDWLNTEYGDADLDGFVDSRDFTTWDTNAFQPGGWAQGDFNGDLYVDGYDFLAWNSAKNMQPEAASRGDDTTKSVSEEREEKLVSDTDDAVASKLQKPLQQPVSSSDTFSTTANHEADDEFAKQPQKDEFLKLG